jgi:hypothetical protein
MNKKEFLARYPEYTDGIVVRSSDGERLGEVLTLRESDFVIEQGFFFPRDYAVRFDQVERIHDGELVLRRHSRDMLREIPLEEPVPAGRKSVTVRGDEIDKQPSLGDRVA